jgi:hypothetical protein
MWDRQFFAIHSAHANFVRRLKERKYTFPYNENTRGIVTTAGGPYLAVALVFHPHAAQDRLYITSRGISGIEGGIRSRSTLRQRPLLNYEDDSLA